MIPYIPVLILDHILPFNAHPTPDHFHVTLCFIFMTLFTLPPLQYLASRARELMGNVETRGTPR